ncbi:translation protein [Lipomyces arxii]|uniref:mitochondrial 54S ribosomal protein uL3m n=1 Tax=Lipomyces arxii TaxID=56418 RepID=UPI0034CFB39E
MSVSQMLPRQCNRLALPLLRRSLTTESRAEIPLSKIISRYAVVDENSASNAVDPAEYQHSPISESIAILPVPENYRRLKRSELPLARLFDSREAALERKQLAARTGAVVVKRGMMGMFEPDGTRVPVTVLQLDRAQVTAVKSVDANGYYAVQVGAGQRHHKNVTRPMLGHFWKAGVPPKKVVREFRVKDGNGLMPVATEITVEHFVEGQYVDVWGTGKGKGFSGVMKRHGFTGLPASHGVSAAHRSAGSTGQSQDPGRVLAGKKMSGRMGGKSVTVHNVKVHKVIPEYGLILVKGPVPGPTNGTVCIQDAIKKPDVIKE